MSTILKRVQPKHLWGVLTALGFFAVVGLYVAPTVPEASGFLATAGCMLVLVACSVGVQIVRKSGDLDFEAKVFDVLFLVMELFAAIPAIIISVYEAPSIPRAVAWCIVVLYGLAGARIVIMVGLTGWIQAVGYGIAVPALTMFAYWLVIHQAEPLVFILTLAFLPIFLLLVRVMQ